MPRLIRALLLVLALSGALVISACGGGSSAVRTIDAAEFVQQAAQPGTTVIDVRTPQEYAAGHLEGAINIDVEGGGFAAAIRALDPKATYAVYCKSGRRSTIATDEMAGSGFAAVYNLDGGIADLESAGGRIVS